MQNYDLVKSLELEQSERFQDVIYEFINPLWEVRRPMPASEKYRYL